MTEEQGPDLPRSGPISQIGKAIQGCGRCSRRHEQVYAVSRGPIPGAGYFGIRTVSITMDDAVVGGNVGSHDLGAVDGHTAHRGIDHDHLALDRLGIGLLPGEGRAHDFSGHHVIGQDLDQLGLVLGLQQVLDRSGEAS